MITSEARHASRASSVSKKTAGVFSPTIQIPILIDGKPIFNPDGNKTQATGNVGCFQGASVSNCHAAVESSSKAFVAWSQTSPLRRRHLLLKLAQLLFERGDEAKELVQAEIHCSETWAAINLSDSIGLIEENASSVTSRHMNGSIPHTANDGSYGFVFNRPLGVVLGIAPWNAPLLLGFRAVVAPVAVGNTAILKLFIDAGFPPGVVNFVLHRPQDAADVVGELIKHPAVRKVNFTGSTSVGRIVARVAGRELKPVLLELGGKNCAIVLSDADIAKAAQAVLEGAMLNGGQICMSTDLVLVTRDVADEFNKELRRVFSNCLGSSYKVISSKSSQRLQHLYTDAAAKGATVASTTAFSDVSENSQHVPFSLIEDIQHPMEFLVTESFGPMVGIVVVSGADEAVEIANSSEYGLSAAIWTRDHHYALGLAQKLGVGAVHVNACTVHDEQTLPHGGHKSSGFGRFGAEWGLQEFVQTQTVILNPYSTTQPSIASVMCLPWIHFNTVVLYDIARWPYRYPDHTK